MGNGPAEVSQEAVLRPLPVPTPERSPLRRWTSHGLIVDVAMLLLANALFLLDDAGSVYGIPLLAAFDVVVIGLVAGSHGYARRLRLDALDDLRLAFTSTAVAAMAIMAIDAVSSADEPSAYGALRLWLLATVLLAIGRLTANLIVAWRRASSRTATTTIIVGAGRVGRLTAIRLLDHPEFGLRPIGFLDAEPMEISGRPLSLPVLGTSSNLARVVATEGVECAVVAFSTDSHDEQLDLLDECERLGIRALIVPRLFERVPSRLQVTHVGASLCSSSSRRARTASSSPSSTRSTALPRSPCSSSCRPCCSRSPSPSQRRWAGRSSIGRIASPSTVGDSTCSSSGP